VVDAEIVFDFSGTDLEEVYPKLVNTFVRQEAQSKEKQFDCMVEIYNC
jgi:hypothetical protein